MPEILLSKKQANQLAVYDDKESSLLKMIAIN